MQPLQDGYGTGLLPTPFNKRPGYGHFGSIDGYRSTFTYFLAEELTVTYRGKGSSSYTVNGLLFGVLAIYFNKPDHQPTFDGRASKSVGQSGYELSSGR